MQQKIVLIGGPGTGKTTVLNALEKRGHYCMPEISREITLSAKKKGIHQLFLSDPLLFSKMLLEGREQQYLEADKTTKNIVFFDRGIPDILGYLDFFKTNYPTIFKEKSKKYRYQTIFHFSPWKDIYQRDNERYESFEDTLKIDIFLINAYKKLGYTIINVPFGNITDRTQFILNSLAYTL